jgi:hypothetical protein
MGSLILEPESIGKHFPARLLEAVSFFFMSLLRKRPAKHVYRICSG